MSNWHVRILITGGAAVLVAALGVPAVLATGQSGWTIQPGGAIQATAGTTTVTDTTSGHAITCTSSTASGTLRSGSGLSGTDAGSLSTVTFTNCTLGGMTVAVQSSGRPWRVNLVGYNSPIGWVFGQIRKIHIAVSSSACSFVTEGTIATADNGWQWFLYRDRTGRLRLKTAGKGRLYAENVSGCPGAISDGDSVRLGAIYTVTPKQTITNP